MSKIVKLRRTKGTRGAPDQYLIAVDREWAEAQLARGRDHVELSDDGNRRLFVQSMTEDEARETRLYRQRAKGAS